MQLSWSIFHGEFFFFDTLCIVTTWCQLNFSNFSVKYRQTEEPAFASCHHEYSGFVPGNDFSWIPIVDCSSASRALSHITILMSPFLLQDNYILFWNVHQEPGVHFNCEETQIFRQSLGQMWWRQASEGNLHFILPLSADSSQRGRIEMQWGRDCYHRAVLLGCSCFLCWRREGDCEYMKPPPIVISSRGCNWAESDLLSDFRTVKWAKLIWVILFI